MSCGIAVESYSRSASASRLGASVPSGRMRRHQCSWNHATWPISHSSGLTIASFAPNNRSPSRSPVSTRRRSRAASRWRRTSSAVSVPGGIRSAVGRLGIDWSLAGKTYGADRRPGAAIRLDSGSTRGCASSYRGSQHENRDRHAVRGEHPHRQPPHGAALRGVPPRRRPSRPGRDELGRQRVRPDDRAPRPQESRLDRALPRQLPGAAPDRGADRHRSLSRHPRRRGGAAFAGGGNRAGDPPGHGSARARAAPAAEGASGLPVGARLAPRPAAAAQVPRVRARASARREGSIPRCARPAASPRRG